MIYDICIVGAGPAGLACAYALRNRNDLKILVIDSGKSLEERNKDHGEDLIQGEGGAGLWSDGKFSFYPAGGPVYSVANAHPAYDQLTTLFRDYDIDIPEFPQLESVGSSTSLQTEHFVQKPYPSFYLSLHDRESLIMKLSRETNAHFMYDTRMTSFHREMDGSIRVEITPRYEVYCMNLIFAGGRFGPSGGFKMPMKTYKRFEFGVRIEVPSHHVLFNGEADDFIDPKFIHVDEQTSVEYRTFCVCRNGSVVDTKFDNMWSCSGSSEIDAGIHNVGFNLRIKSNYKDHFDFLMTVLHQLGTDEPFHHATFEDLKHVKGPFHFGDEATDLIIKGLEKLREQFPVFASDDIRFSGPTVEGVGYYPNIDPTTLECVFNNQIMVIGDSSGIFRGTIPALLSGLAAAQKFLIQ